MVKKVKTAFSFAHLIGLGAARAEGDQENNQNQDEERKQRDGESDEDYAKRMEELDKKNEAEGSDPDPDAEDDDNTAGESDKEQAARAKERARCAAIFGSKAAACRPDVAAHLAFNTSMSVREAVGMLDSFAAAGPTAGSAPRQSLGSRMAGVKPQNVGSGGATVAANPSQAAAALILDAGKKRRGES